MIREGMREMSGNEEPDACAEAEVRRLLAAAFETAPVRSGLAADLAATASAGGTVPPTENLVGQVRRRAAVRRRTRVLVPAGAMVLAAAVAGGVTAGTLADNGGAAAPGSLKVLTDAVVKTSAQSFTFNLTFAQTHSDTGPSSPEHMSGAFDPAAKTGKEDVTVPGDPQVHVLFTGKYMYVSHQPMKFTDGKPWVKTDEPVPPQPGSRGAAHVFFATGFHGQEPPNPADLLALLESATTVSKLGPASGPGWTGTSYRFTESTPSLGESGTYVTLHGTVSVDSSGRVRDLATATQWEGESSVEGRPPVTFTNIYHVTFGGFGVPVTVTAPPATQADYKKNVMFTLP